MGKEKMTKLEKQWVLYDVGNSAFVMLVSTIIPIYFKNMATASGISAANSTAYLSYAISISTILVALLGPVCGAAADNKGFKKPLFTAFMMIGVIACAAMGIPKTWLAFLVVFVIAKVGFSGSLIFYDSMLVDVTTDERMDEVSSHGYAWGYIGSCIPFVGSLILVLMSDRIGISAAMAMMLAFGITAIWWVAVTIPLLLNYKQKTEMIHQGNWCYSLFSSYDVDFDMGIAPLPIAGNKSIAVGVPSVWCVNTDASDSDKQLAKDFLNWLYTSETGADYLTNKFGFIPVVDGMEADNLDPLSQAVSDAIAEGNIIPWTFNEEWPAGIITTYLVQNAEEYFSSDMTTDEFLRALNDSFVTAANE